MYCYVCGKFGVTLYRQNEKGQKGVWACDEHNFKKVEPIVEEIIKILEVNNDSN